jgi:hypothetical protein
MMPGAVCSCGALIFGPAPEVHTFLATHPANADHRVTALLPNDSAKWARIRRAYARLLSEALTS